MTITNTAHQHQDVEYDQYINAINARIAATPGPIFLTDADPGEMWRLYLDSFPPDDRQFHNCSCCRDFIKRFGGLATVNDSGQLISLAWDEQEAPMRYKYAAGALQRLVRKAKIIQPFLSAEKILGHPEAGGWHHFAILNRNVFGQRGLTPYQAMASKREDFKNLMVALNEFNSVHVNALLTLAQAEVFSGSEKVVGQLQLLAQLHDLRQPSARSHGLLWRAIAQAPDGFCHPRSSLIGPMLEGLAAGESFATIERKFKAMTHPLQYQRPQAAPTAGAIAQAEKQFAASGLAPALQRRFATIDDVQVKLWEPQPAPILEGGSVFGHLKAKGAADIAPLAAPAKTITFEKFRRTVLPTAERIQYRVSNLRANYTALTAAVDPSAPAILQWDDEKARNTVAWYLYHGGSVPSQWNLTPGDLVDVTAVTLAPHKWADEEAFSHQSNGVLFILKGARDTRKGQGNALFPSTLKSDLHGMRSVIEAYSKSAVLQGQADASACGILFQSTPVDVIVTTGGQRLTYHIDRMD
jgi:hypothetical protein